MDNQVFGKIVKNKLIDHNMTQKKLAESIDIDPVTLNRYIKGERNIPLPTLKKVADFFNVQPEQLLGSDDPDILIWHYNQLEGAYIDIDKGFEQALEQGRDKTFVYPIMRKYYSKSEMQDLVDSYDSAEKTEKEIWPEDKPDTGIKQDCDAKIINKGQKEQHYIPITNLAPPESLFEGESTEEKKELLELYFAKLKEIVEITNR